MGLPKDENVSKLACFFSIFKTSFNHNNLIIQIYHWRVFVQVRRVCCLLFFLCFQNLFAKVQPPARPHPLCLPAADGVVKYCHLKQLYDASQHPDVQCRSKTLEQVLTEYWGSWVQGGGSNIPFCATGMNQRLRSGGICGFFFVEKAVRGEQNQLYHCFAFCAWFGARAGSPPSRPPHYLSFPFLSPFSFNVESQFQTSYIHIQGKRKCEVSVLSSPWLG